MKKIWQVQEAKARFSQVMNNALEHGPQIISKHGEEAAMLISIADYNKLTKKQNKLSCFFHESPLRDAGLDLNRIHDLPRDIEL